MTAKKKEEEYSWYSWFTGFLAGLALMTVIGSISAAFIWILPLQAQLQEYGDWLEHPVVYLVDKENQPVDTYVNCWYELGSRIRCREHPRSCIEWGIEEVCYPTTRIDITDVNLSERCEFLDRNKTVGICPREVLHCETREFCACWSGEPCAEEQEPECVEPILIKHRNRVGDEWEETTGCLCYSDEPCALPEEELREKGVNKYGCKGFEYVFEGDDSSGGMLFWVKEEDFFEWFAACDYECCDFDIGKYADFRMRNGAVSMCVDSANGFCYGLKAAFKKYEILEASQEEECLVSKTDVNGMISIKDYKACLGIAMREDVGERAGKKT